MANEENDFDEFELNDETIQELLRIEEEEKAKKAQQTVPTKIVPPAPTKTEPNKKAEPYRYPERIQIESRVPSTQILSDPQLVRFFQGRELDPEHYFYTPEGNLETKGVKDVPDSVYYLREQFQPLTEPTYVELMAKREEELKERERVFEGAVKNLRDRLSEYILNTGTTAETVVLANTAVLEASKQRTLVAYPEKWTNSLENPVTNEILIMYEPYEKRKMGYPVVMMKHNQLDRKVAFGSYVERTNEEDVQEGGSLRIRFITDVNDEKTGHFHPFTQRGFKFNETEYCCPYQAFEGERFKQLGKEDLRQQILGTRSGRTIHAIAVKDKTMINAPQQLWEDILFQFFYQHPDFRKELDATGLDKFHVMDKEVPADYGTFLEKARLRLRELGDKELDHQEVKEKVITEEEQKKAKVGAIIHNFKKKF